MTRCLTLLTDLYLVTLKCYVSACRLVEVNSVPVLNSTVEEVTELLLQGASAQIVVLRHPPPAVASQQHPLLPLTPSTMQNIGLERAAVTMETPPQRKVIAI